MNTRNVLDWLEEAACFAPDAPAFESTGGSMTWSEVCRRARSIGSMLRKLIPRQVPVLILMEKSPECLCAMFGTVYAGCFYTPLDSAMPEARMKLIAEKLQPAAVLYEEKYAETARRIAGPALLLSVSEIPDTADMQEPDVRRSEHIDNDLLYVLFTSGSTGTPKGVSITHRSVIDFIDWACPALRLPEGVRFGSPAPFHFDNSVLDIYCTVRMRGTLYLIPKGDFMFPVRLLKRLQEEKINTIFWVPSALTALAKAGVLTAGCLPELQRVFFCGETMPCGTLNLWKQAVPEADYVNMYGPTEITDVCTWFRADRRFTDTDSLPIGFPCGNTRVFLLDGEICVTGTCLSPGYYNDPDKTAAAFVQNPLNHSYPETIYRTGDLVFINDCGEIVFKGRRDSLIKHMGYRIELGEIEHVIINTLKLVKNGCVVYNHQRKEITLYYEADNELTAADFRKAIGNTLPKYMIPVVYHHMPELKRNTNGKIDRLYYSQLVEE